MLRMAKARCEIRGRVLGVSYVYRVGWVGESRRLLGSGLKDLVDGSSIYQGIKSKGKRERDCVLKNA